MKNLSNWRSVRVLEGRIERELRRRHSLRLHGLCIGLVTMGLMWGVSHLQMVMGMESLAWRYLITLGSGYLAYLLVIRLWAAQLLGRDKRSSSADGGGDVPDLFSNLPDFQGGGGGGSSPHFQSGGGGDFGGGGASGDFSVGDVGGGLGDVASGALDAVGGADEGAVVVIPVLAIFLIGVAVFFGAGALMLMFFGWEVLLTVAIELAFSYVSARAAVRVVREGWVSAVIRLTWKPLVGAIACAVALGAAIDYFIPAANSLPQAVKLIRAQSGPGVH
ncbi:hypothetical protein SAMN05216350_104324 [Polaromonas sp. YR568]|uniref:hypothetical protein n=1 Tax=Polaromonas sp. YR568 TaxID=1855301 RepID=UPI0008E2FF10|nr:hypothetical protein [Polaromonas sp. YR568]SFU74654.1 hypothetical protein SAMN05216350_104324 [Polaromonas sp. YR568]